MKSDYYKKIERYLYHLYEPEVLVQDVRDYYIARMSLSTSAWLKGSNSMENQVVKMMESRQLQESKIKLLEVEDDKFCAELEIVIVLKDNTKYYIGLIKKSTSKRSLKYRKACKLAEKIVGYLEFIEQTKKMTNGFTAKPCVVSN